MNTHTPDDAANWQALANAMRAARAHRRLSQHKLATTAEVSVRIVQYLESGEPRSSVTRVIPRIERVLGWPGGTTERIVAGDLDAIPVTARADHRCEICATAETWRKNITPPGKGGGT